MILTFCIDGILHLKLPQGVNMLKLQDTARRIWELLEYPISTEEIVQKLAAEFYGDRATIAADTERLLNLLLAKQVIEHRPDPSSEERQRFRYLGLLKRCLLNLIYAEHELRIRILRTFQGGLDDLETRKYFRDIRYREPDLFNELIDNKYYLDSYRYTPPHTMISLTALDNIERCAEILFGENIEGDFLEAGVCQGGAAIFMRALQIAHGQGDRTTWVADSFQGLPQAEAQPDIETGYDFTESSMPVLSFSLQGVKDNFATYDLLDEGVAFLPGWFSETLPNAPLGPLALLRLDADMYASTMVALRHLYPRLTRGGFIIVDDYRNLECCRRAVDDYRESHGIREPLQFMNPNVVYWRKET